MFTGIVECVGKIKNIELLHENIELEIEAPFTPELNIDQSVAHNGICLTVISLQDNSYKVCAIPETISKTTIQHWKINDVINLERGMLLSNRLDGHIVQGHVDTIAQCTNRSDQEASWNYTFTIDTKFAHLIIEKGSITVNGTSLTCFNVTENSFEVAIIPYTFENTTIHQITKNDYVNIEFDIIGKYFTRMKQLQLEK